MRQDKRPAKICVVAPYPPRKGGVTVQTDLLVRNLEKDGYTVLKVDTNLQRLRIRGLGPLRLLLQPLIVFIRLLINVPRSDVVHFESASYWGFMPTVLGVPIARLFGKRSVISYHGGKGAEFMDRYPWLVKRIFNWADVLTVCSLQLQDAFKKKGVSSIFLKNMFDSNLFKFRERTDIEPRIMWSRSMDAIYDPLAALKIFEIIRKKHPGVKLVMTSNGKMMQTVKSYVEVNGLDNVTLPGRVSHKELARLLNESSLYLNTSKQDGLPTSLLEAAASGLPIVTTNAGGIVYLFEHRKNAMLSDVGDVEGLAASLLYLIDNPEKAIEMGKAANAATKEYTWPYVWKVLVKAYGLDDVKD